MTNTLIRAMLAAFTALVLAACEGVARAPGIVEIDQGPVYVTATYAPTAIPTSFVATPTRAMPATATPGPPTPVLACADVLDALFNQASNSCLKGPTGAICNGGLGPRTMPGGRVMTAMAVPGALLDAETLVSLHTPALLTENSGGVVWLRVGEAGADHRMSALLLGDVRLDDIGARTTGTPQLWQNLTVETSDPADDCAARPRSALVIQADYGSADRIILNGTTVEVNGTLLVQAVDDATAFLALEGSTRIRALGDLVTLNAGQQLDVGYEGDWTRPVAVLAGPAPLDTTRIEGFPIMLLDRPVRLPQGGSVETQGLVNMRAEPRLGSLLLYQVPAGEVLAVLGRDSSGQWLHIQLGNGETGWMSAELLAGTTGDIRNTYDLTPTPPRRFGNVRDTGIITVAQGSNLRQFPDTSFRVLDTLPYGTEVEIIARSPYSPWVKVRAGEGEGWVALMTIDTTTVVSFLPVDYDVQYPPRPTALPDFSWGGGHAFPDPSGGY
jgi:SH3-like domain-containing protein